MIKTNLILKSFVYKNIPKVYCLSLNNKISQNTHRFQLQNNYFYESKQKSNFNNENIVKICLKTCVIASIGSLGIYLLNKQKNKINAKEVDNDWEQFGGEIKGLKSFTAKEVSEHNSMSKRIWCSYRRGVYDITEFVGRHPGGDKILMASGGSLEPFWMLFAVHKSEQVLSVLENYRIGNLAVEDSYDSKHTSDDPYGQNEPLRHPALSPRSVKPFNAEPPPEILVESFLTPNDLFFVRNHLPVPEIDVNSYKLEIEGFGLKEPKSLSLDEIKNKFPKKTITAAIQCAGNRRNEMNKVKEVKGLAWGSAAISNAEWSGALLVDVLKYCGLDFKDKNIKHIQLEGLDFDVSSNPYGASVESQTALNPNSDFLIAYEMNGEPIPLDHGFPLRFIAPGIVGARNVKWLSRIVISDEESHSHWQRKDYKSFSPNVDWNNVDFETAPSIQELPVQSAICDPIDSKSVKMDGNRNVVLRGYAWSGGGRKIVRVDVSADEGKHWFTADLQQEDTPLNRTYSWTLWKANIPIPIDCKSGDNIVFVCKATDSSYNSQPESVNNIWNLRGVVNNCWHRISVTVN